MPDGGEAYEVRVHGAIGDIAAAEWDLCAGDGNPFVRHAFLSAVEESGSAAARSGWAARHLAVHDADGRLVGCAPLYLKSHSYGEYVFDWAWAEAYEKAGLSYYPKLQAAVPFTPVAGPRLLVRPGAPAETADVLAGAMVRLAETHGVSSLHVTFPHHADWQRLQRFGFLPRIGHQYHWHNRGYERFDDFLADLASRKRKAIRKERAAIAGHGLTLRTLTGAEIEERHWDDFHRFYLDTVERKWAHAYLKRAFFLELGQRLGDAVVLMVAETDAGLPVAAALNLVGGDALYGRYWGCRADCRFLHFELCYYMAIDYAIAHGLGRVEAGAQGEHKIQRGYLPRETYSAHWIADPGFRTAIARYLASERAAVAAEIEGLAAASPYRSAGAEETDAGAGSG